MIPSLTVQVFVIGQHILTQIFLNPCPTKKEKFEFLIDSSRALNYCLNTFKSSFIHSLKRDDFGGGQGRDDGERRKIFLPFFFCRENKGHTLGLHSVFVFFFCLCETGHCIVRRVGSSSFCVFPTYRHLLSLPPPSPSFQIIHFIIRIMK